jgi:prepilin-type N-terminal cleavage/methylation domain-containing protein
MRLRTGPAARRAGFSLAELLVVIAIIGILMSLAGAAYFKWIDTQRRHNTEATVRSVYTVLQRQVKAVLDKANTETIPNSVSTLAGGDINRARVIWKKLRLKQEFPVSYYEAWYPSNAANGTPILPAADLPPKSVYTRAIPKPSSTAVGPTESAACLLLALQQDRKAGRDGTLNPDSLPANSVLDTDGDGLKELVDGWGAPLAFYRWPTSTDVNALNPGKTKKALTFADPLDPDGLLLQPGWYGTAGRTQLESLCHALSPDGGQTAWYIIPVLVSAGPDGVLGVDPTTMAAVAPANTPDNIYSYQVMALGARGGTGP